MPLAKRQPSAVKRNRLVGLEVGKSIRRGIDDNKKGAVANRGERQRDDLTCVVDQVTGAAKTTVNMTAKRSRV